MVFHDAVWHNFSAYEGSGEGRVELNGGYCARWMNPAVNDYGIVRRSVHERLPPALQRLNRRPVADLPGGQSTSDSGVLGWRMAAGDKPLPYGCQAGDVAWPTAMTGRHRRLAGRRVG